MAARWEARAPSIAPVVSPTSSSTAEARRSAACSATAADVAPVLDPLSDPCNTHRTWHPGDVASGTAHPRRSMEQPLALHSPSTSSERSGHPTSHCVLQAALHRAQLEQAPAKAANSVARSSPHERTHCFHMAPSDGLLEWCFSKEDTRVESWFSLTAVASFSRSAASGPVSSSAMHACSTADASDRASKYSWFIWSASSLSIRPRPEGASAGRAHSSWRRMLARASLRHPLWARRALLSTATTVPDEFAPLIPDTCCGTVPHHTRQVVLLTATTHSSWPARPEAEKGSLAWRYDSLMKAGRRSPPDSLGACGVSAEAEDDSPAAEECGPAKLLLGDATHTTCGNDQFDFVRQHSSYTDGLSHAVLVFPDSLLIKGLRPHDAASVVSALSEPVSSMGGVVERSLEATGSPARVEELTGLHLLVCAHSRRDKRCGENGTAVVGWFRRWAETVANSSLQEIHQWRKQRRALVAQDVDPGSSSFVVPRGVSLSAEVDRFSVPCRQEVNVWPVSHVGLHRMAANVLANPPGDWFAHMHDESDAAALFEHLVRLGAASVPPSLDRHHPLRRCNGTEMRGLGLAEVGWDIPLDEGSLTTRRQAAMYQNSPVADVIQPVARWWRGRMGLSKEEQQRVFLEVDPSANLDHAKLSAQFMGKDRH
jgi:hypothetical protein